jgi:hypothetical protein
MVEKQRRTIPEGSTGQGEMGAMEGWETYFPATNRPERESSEFETTPEFGREAGSTITIGKASGTYSTSRESKHTRIGCIPFGFWKEGS